MLKILLIEDDVNFAQHCIETLIRFQFDIVYFENIEGAKNHLLDNHVDLMVIDLMLPPTYGLEGLSFLEFVKATFPSIETFLMTSKEKGTIEIVAKAMKLGAKYFFDKNSTVFKDNLTLKVREFLLERRRNIFISHGHNELLKLKLKDFIINRLGKEVLILSDQPSQGLTVVEKLEKASIECCYAVILMTNDDEQKSGSLRARQNVIHEIGFFQGKYGRNNVILLAEKGVEIFSNISGIIRIEFEADKFEAVYEPLRIEIEEAFKR